MRRLLLFFALLATICLSPRTSRAGTPEIEVDLLVMGPGDHLYTRGGHAALMVAEIEDGELVRSTVYNYGDTDWEDPMLVPRFLRGDLTFFLSDTGSIESTLQEYGVRQGREITRQRLNLTAAQAAEVANRLREGLSPGKREYTFHHVHALCSTKIMDLLDDVMGGALRAELAGQPGPSTGRHYQDLIFSESLLAVIAGDLFIGRQHDRVLDKWESTASPEHMRDYLQSIFVPRAPGASEKVPFAETPVLLVARTTPLVLSPSWAGKALWGALLLLLLGAGAVGYRRARAAVEGTAVEGTAAGRTAVPAKAAGTRASLEDKGELAAKVIVWASLVSGVIGLLILGLTALSKVPEFNQNELILVFWPADLWLAWQAWRARKSGGELGLWTARYVHARLFVAALAVGGHAAGILHQEPRIVLALGVVEAGVLWTLVRALRGVAATTPKPAPVAFDTTPAPSG